MGDNHKFIKEGPNRLWKEPGRGSLCQGVRPNGSLALFSPCEMDPAGTGGGSLSVQVGKNAERDNWRSPSRAARAEEAMNLNYHEYKETKEEEQEARRQTETALEGDGHGTEKEVKYNEAARYQEDLESKCMALPHETQVMSRKTENYTCGDNTQILEGRHRNNNKRELEEKEKVAAGLLSRRRFASDDKDKLQNGLATGDAGHTENEYLRALHRQGAIPKRKTAPDHPEQGPLTRASHSNEIPRLEISGIPSDISEDILMGFLQNKKQCWGGEIEHFEFCADKGTALVTYADLAGQCHMLAF